MMDTSYFGFKDAPFQDGLNPRNFCNTATYEAAYEAIIRGLQTRCGLITVSGMPGTGKSALLLAKMADLSRIAHCIFFSGTDLSLDTVLDDICLELMGLELSRQSTTEQIQLLKECLAQPSNQQKTIALIIDDAEELAESVLDTLLSLEDSPAGTRTVQIILLGLPCITKRFRLITKNQELIPIHCRITPLSDYDIDSFIKHQLQAAGYDNDRQLFPPPAVEAIAAYTGGVPAAINILCDTTLTLAQKHRTKTLTKEIVDEAWTLCAKKIEQTTAQAELPPPSLPRNRFPTPVQSVTGVSATKADLAPENPPNKAAAKPTSPRGIKTKSSLQKSSAEIHQITLLPEQTPQVSDNQRTDIEIKSNRSRHLLLGGVLAFIVVLIGQGFVIFNYEPTPTTQAPTLQPLPQLPLAIAQQEVQPVPSVDPAIIEPAQTFTHSPLPGPGLSPNTNFVEITDGMNTPDALREFPNSNDYEQKAEPVAPPADKDSPFIELR